MKKIPIFLTVIIFCISQQLANANDVQMSVNIYIEPENMTITNTTIDSTTTTVATNENFTVIYYNVSISNKSQDPLESLYNWLISLFQ